MGILSSLHQNLEVVFDTVFPKEKPWSEFRKIEGNLCKRCGYPFEMTLTHEISDCPNCNGLQWKLDQAFAPYAMEGDPRKSILEFKYHRKFFWRRALGQALYEGYLRQYCEKGWDGLVPVPLHSSKRRDRGFNQAEELAMILSRRTEIPVLNCLSRHRETLSQAAQNRVSRLRNLRGSFECIGRFDVRGRSLLIIDDVLTTGTTANECAQVLRDAGAGYVAVLAVARGI